MKTTDIKKVVEAATALSAALKKFTDAVAVVNAAEKKTPVKRKEKVAAKKPTSPKQTSRPPLDLLCMPETQIGTKLYAKGLPSDIYCTVVDHNTVDFMGERVSVSGASWRMVEWGVKLELCENHSRDWRTNLVLDDGTSIGSLWSNFVKNHPNAEVKRSRVKNLVKAWWFVKKGEKVYDPATGKTGVWTEDGKYNPVVKFEGCSEMSAQTWIKKHYTKKNSKWQKHFVDVKTGKTYGEIKNEKLIGG